MLASKNSPSHLPELPPELRNEVEGLQLSARSIASGALAGMHRSLRRGASIEFSEHKLYSPGDDIRHIDWRAFAKTDRYHVKQFEDETNTTTPKNLLNKFYNTNGGYEVFVNKTLW